VRRLQINRIMFEVQGVLRAGSVGTMPLCTGRNWGCGTRLSRSVSAFYTVPLPTEDPQGYLEVRRTRTMPVAQQAFHAAARQPIDTLHTAKALTAGSLSNLICILPWRRR